MIAFVSGQVTAAGPDGAVVDVGGVGLSVQCTPATLATLRVGDRAHVPTSLVVREDSLTLYGFADEDERTVFELLQTASGVGPRLALAMLAVHPPNALRRAVATEDLAALTQVPGIGKKGAQRIVLELKDRLGGPADGGTGAAHGPGTSGPAGVAATSWRTQVHTGLVNLGWSAKDADAAVEAVADDLRDGSAGHDGQNGQDGQDGRDVPAGADMPDIAALLKSALKKLSRS